MRKLCVFARNPLKEGWFSEGHIVISIKWFHKIKYINCKYITRYFRRYICLGGLYRVKLASNVPEFLPSSK